MRKIIALVLILTVSSLVMACNTKIPKKEKAVSEKPKYSFVGKPVEPFKVKDLDGNEWTEAVYSENKITMHVFWSPNCVPCIEELEALQKIKEKEKDLGIKLLSFCVEGTKEDVAQLKKTYEMEYPIIMMSEESLMTECTKDFEFIPFVIFVDQDGKYMKDFLVGSRTYDEYMAHLKTLGVL